MTHLIKTQGYSELSRNMKTFKHTFFSILIVSILVTPMVSFAVAPPNEDGGLIPCGTEATSQRECNFKDFLTMINKVIEFVLYKLAMPIAAIMFAYAGILLVTAGGGEGKTKAKTIFLNTFLGLIIAIGAVLIVKTILFISGYEDTRLYF